MEVAVRRAERESRPRHRGPTALPVPTDLALGSIRLALDALLAAVRAPAAELSDP
ncbi:hypothetical protein M446_4348 [Methylobacterium sp. 4-46]|nr:hypothetical protein M446_4348 [Methylobacterium sp. 4-46]